MAGRPQVGNCIDQAWKIIGQPYLSTVGRDPGAAAPFGRKTGPWKDVFLLRVVAGDHEILIEPLTIPDHDVGQHILTVPLTPPLTADKDRLREKPHRTLTTRTHDLEIEVEFTGRADEITRSLPAASSRVGIGGPDDLLCVTCLLGTGACTEPADQVTARRLFTGLSTIENPEWVCLVHRFSSIIAAVRTHRRTPLSGRRHGPSPPDPPDRSPG